MKGLENLTELEREYTFDAGGGTEAREIADAKMYEISERCNSYGERMIDVHRHPTAEEIKEEADYQLARICAELGLGLVRRAK